VYSWLKSKYWRLACSGVRSAVFLLGVLKIPSSIGVTWLLVGFEVHFLSFDIPAYPVLQLVS